jgi:16S rRNA (guanine527-N7)-methyltransferase
VTSDFTYPLLSADQCRCFEQFARMLQAGNKVHNLTRITDTEQIYIRHFVDSLQVLPILDSRDQAGRLMDVGSGAGLPGLAVAIARPGWQVVSVEATAKKVRFQEAVVTSLGLDHVQCIHGRAEDLAHDDRHRAKYDIVTVRAVAQLSILVEWCIPLLKVNGILVAFRGKDAQQEIVKAQGALQVLGARIDQVRSYGLQDLAGKVGLSCTDSEPVFHLVTIIKQSPTPKAYPRRFSRIKNEPL